MNRKTILKTIVNTLKALALPILVFVAFAILTNGRSSSQRMIMTTLRQSVLPMLVCYSIMLNMVVGMINFSAGAAILLSGIVGGSLALATGTGVLGVVLFSTITGISTGALTGFIYIKLRVPCMVLTIGLMLAYEAMPRLVYPNGVNLTWTYTTLAVAPYCFVVAGIMIVIFYVISNLTAFGHNLRAIGSNQAIADSVGLNSDRSKFLSFLCGGLFIGIAAAMYVSTNAEVRPTTAIGSMVIMLDGFIGMFLAMFISRYCNLAIAIPISVVTMKMISNGFVSLGMSATIRDVTNGVLLLVLLTISANQGLFERMKQNKLFAQKADAEYQSTRTQ